MEESLLRGYGKDKYWRFYGPLKYRIAGGWKAEYQQELEELGYKLKKSITIDELHRLLLHHRTAHVCYDACSDAELKRFAGDRRLTTARQNVSRRTLVKKLMDADANPTFARFVDLPPELRTLIYDLYMSDFTGQTLTQPTQPPLARASALLRREALPIFYAKCRIDCEFVVDADDNLSLGRRSQHYLRRLDDHSIGLMRKLEIKVQPDMIYSRERDRPRVRPISFATFYMSMNDANFSIDSKEREKAAFSPEEEERMKKGVSSIMKDVVGRTGQCKLTRKDFDAFVAALQASLLK